jgi:hypothetical protein
MSAARKRAGKEPSAPEKRTPTTDSPAASSGQEGPACIGAGRALDECVGAISLIEVTQRSLESKEIASAEQEVLARALKALWGVHDWIYERTPDDPDDAHANPEDES